MKYSCIIVDDEPLSHDVLKNHLKGNTEVQVVAGFFNAHDAGLYLEQNPVDIMLLDIQMPEINGLDFLRSLPIKPVSIITTAFRDYALEGFELGVIDYLLKPIIFERFQTAMKRAVNFLQLVKAGSSIDFGESNGHFEILIKSGTKKILLDYRKIIFAQGLKDYTILHTTEKQYVVKGSIKAFEEYLPADYFVRVHKSFIVAKSKIKIVHKNKIDLDPIFIPVGRIFRSRIDSILNGH
jgi:DNA-binding LytR/AlgR family response regulator